MVYHIFSIEIPQPPESDVPKKRAPPIGIWKFTTWSTSRRLDDRAFQIVDVMNLPEDLGKWNKSGRWLTKPLWKMMEFVNWDEEIPTISGKKFQTTNQKWFTLLFQWGRYGKIMKTRQIRRLPPVATATTAATVYQCLVPINATTTELRGNHDVGLAEKTMLQHGWKWLSGWLEIVEWIQFQHTMRTIYNY